MDNIRSIELKAYAKINLFFDIIGKRNDGYHEVKTVMQEIDLHDIVKVEQIEQIEKIEKIEKIDEASDAIEICCSDENIPTDERNTCYKIAKCMKDMFNLKEKIRISIEKNVPSEAGMGGGSSDAAAVVLGINNLWNLNLSISKMREIASVAGADTAFFITGGTCLCEGIGDKITELKPFVWDNILIIKPEFSISTKKAYQNVTADEYNLYKNNKMLEYIDNGDYRNVCLNIANTLEKSVLKFEPEIENIKSKLKTCNAINQMMTGSGSVIYGFFENEEMLKNAYEEMKKTFKNVYMTKTIQRI